MTILYNNIYDKNIVTKSVRCKVLSRSQGVVRHSE
jgi:hypothetical protein